MDILKKNKIKSFLIIILLLMNFCFLQISVHADDNQIIEITNIEANKNLQSIKFNIKSNISKNRIIKYGVLLSKYDEELVIENDKLVNYEITNSFKENFSVNIKIPESAFYQKIYIVAYVVLNNEIIYSNKVHSSYARLANLDKVIIKDIKFDNYSLLFNMATTLDYDAEYGLLFSKDELISDITLENAKNAHFETQIIKLDNLNENNEYFVTIKDIPINELNNNFLVCAYVKDNKTLETYYTKTYHINILDIYFDKIINNISISYNENYDGIKFLTNSCLTNNNDYTLGFVFSNKYTTDLNIKTINACVVECNSDKFSVTMKNFPRNKYDEKIYVVAFIKYLNNLNEFEYYYSNIYITSYNEVKVI